MKNSRNQLWGGLLHSRHAGCIQKLQLFRENVVGMDQLCAGELSAYVENSKFVIHILWKFPEWCNKFMWHITVAFHFHDTKRRARCYRRRAGGCNAKWFCNYDFCIWLKCKRCLHLPRHELNFCKQTWNMYWIRLKQSNKFSLSKIVASLITISTKFSFHQLRVI